MVRVLQLIIRIRDLLVELNLFESGSTDIEVIQQERWSSRINIMLLLFILSSIAIYTSLDQQTTHVTVKNLSYEIFLILQEKYPSTLKCPCSKIAIKYGKFLELKPSYHQVCSSSFISEEWIMASYAANSSYIWPMDVRTVASSYAQSLHTFCRLSRLTLDSIIIDSLGAFLISPQALFSSYLKFKIDEQIKVVRSTGPWFLTAQLISMRFLITCNQFISGLGSSAIVYVPPDENDIASININTYQMKSGSFCRCYPTVYCRAPAAVYSNPVQQTLGVFHLNVNSTPVKGMEIACSPFEGFLSSTLECYFDSSCFQLLVSNSSNFTPLNSTETSRFLPNTTMEDLITELLVEEWLFDSSPANYFHECAPSACSYSYTHRNTLLTIITTIVAIFTGVNTILRLIIPSIIQYVFKLKVKFLGRFSNSSKPTIHWVQTVAETHNDRNQINIKWLWIKIKTLNLFNSNSDDLRKIRYEQYTTRLYIILLFFIFLTLVFYTAFSTQTKTYTINRPTQLIYENLQMKYSDTLQCPCSNVSIPHDKFILIETKYHQICSSGFISPFFIGQLYEFNRTNLHRADFMSISGIYFTWIASICGLSQIVLYNLYNSFQKELFVTQKLLPENIFTKQTDDIIQSFIDSTTFVFGRALNESLEITSSLQILSASYFSFDLRITPNGNIRIDPSGFDNCSCLLHPKTCSTVARFYSYNSFNESFTILSTVNGIRLGCISSFTVLQSNLECWYSTDCYEQVINHWRSRGVILNYIPPLLDPTITSRFNMSSSILIILEKLMTEQWSKKVSYSAFFTQCDPLYCIYSKNELPSIIFIITTVIGIFSGLNVVLKLFTPLILRILFWYWTSIDERQNIFEQFKQLPDRLIKLNLFFDHRKSSIHTIQKEIHSTRLYISVFILIFTIFLLYNILEEETITITIERPTQTIYEQLYSSFSSSLQCPCSQISIPYESFVNMTADLHQICSSFFLNTKWIESIYSDGNWSNLPSNQFRVRGVLYFFTLQSLCTTARGKIRSAGPYLFDRQIISSQILPENQLVAQINSEVDQLRRSYSSTFLSLIQFARTIIHENQFMTVYSLNWIYAPQHISNIPFQTIPTEVVRHGENCSCATSLECTEPIFVNNEIIPGFSLGCTALESLLRSSLNCLYNQTCINLLNIGNLSNVTRLDPSLPSQYQPNMTFDKIVPSMFIEQWSSNISYSTFFAQCQPLLCTYSVSQRKDILKIITILLGIYGGLTTVLHFIVPFIITIIAKTIRKFQGTNNVIIPLQ